MADDLETARVLKEVGARSEAEIVAVLAKMDGEAKTKLKIGVKRVSKCLEEIKKKR